MPDRRVAQAASVALLIAPAAAVLAGCAIQYPMQRSSEEVADRTRTALMAAADPDSLAAADALDAHGTPAQRLALLTRAAAAAPGRADLTWVQLQACYRVESCDAAPIEARLHALDPGNAAAWAVSLARSGERHDEAAVQAALANMAAAERFETYWNPVVVHTAHAMIRTGLMDPSAAVVASVGAAAAQALPFQQMVNACHGQTVERPERLETCRRLSGVLRRGDTYVTELIGLAIAERAWGAGSAEYQEAEEARRVALYRVDAEASLSARFSESGGALDYLDLLATHSTEQQAFVADITAAGLDPNPPPGWTEPPEPPEGP